MKKGFWLVFGLLTLGLLPIYDSASLGFIGDIIASEHAESNDVNSGSKNEQNLNSIYFETPHYSERLFWMGFGCRINILGEYNV